MNGKKTNMELSELVSLLQSYFDIFYFYAKEIMIKIYSVLKAKCSGCQNSRLSQMDHACLMLTNEQQLKLYMYFEDILLDVDEYDIIKQ